MAALGVSARGVSVPTACFSLAEVCAEIWELRAELLRVMKGTEAKGEAMVGRRGGSSVVEVRV